MTDPEPDFESWIEMEDATKNVKVKPEPERPGDRNDVSNSTMWAIAAIVVGCCCVAGSLGGWIAWLFR